MVFRSRCATSLMEAESIDRAHGLPAAPIPESISCAICLQVQFEPVKWPGAPAAGGGEGQTTEPSSCGHTFCKNCTIHVLQSRTAPVCPLCRTPAAPGAKFEDLPVDQPTFDMVQNDAPELYAARVASRAEARERELSLRQSLPQLLLYTLGSKCEFASGFVLTLRLREAAHMWLVVKLLTSGERKLGVLLGPEVAGTDGRMATVCNLPFCNPIPLAKAVSRVMWEKKSQGYVSLRLRIGADHFRAVFVSHALEASEHQAWRQLASVADTLSGVVPTPLPAAQHANAPRLASAHVVMAPRAAGLRTAVNVAIASANIWCAKASRLRKVNRC